jgi:hypothetical protein
MLICYLSYNRYPYVSIEIPGFLKMFAPLQQKNGEPRKLPPTRTAPIFSRSPNMKGASWRLENCPITIWLLKIAMENHHV